MKRIFVSSTFRDMQAERDEIQKTITPQLRAMARAYGEDIELCDLRWGVNTTDLDGVEGSKKVLSVCLDEIDRCRPYMLVILGARYGWIPDGKLLQDAVQRKKYELRELEKSVTALEIEYGALSDPESVKKTIFMFREPLPEADNEYQSEDAEHAVRLEALKDRIRKLAGDRVFSYQVQWDDEKKCPVGLEQFSGIVTKQLWRLLEHDLKAYGALSDAEKEYRNHWNWVDNKAAQFGGRQELLAICKEKLEQQSRSLLLTGAAGNGKSALCARLIFEFRQQGWSVFPFVCGQGGQRSSGLDVLKYLVTMLEESLDTVRKSQYQHDMAMMWDSTPVGSAESGWSSWSIRLELLLRNYYRPEGKQVLFAVIGTENLEQDQETKNFRYIPKLKVHNLHVLVTCDEYVDTRNFIGERLVVPELWPKEKEALIHRMMSFYGKAVDGSVMNEIVQKKQSGKPLYLSLLTQYLLTFDQDDFAVIADGGNDMAAISRYQKQVVRNLPDDILPLSRAIFRRLEKSISTEFISAVTEYIAASRFGLREQDLKQLLERRNIPWSSIDFSRLINYASTLFIERSGTFNFSSTALKNDIRSQIDLDRITSELFEYVKCLPDEDLLKISEMVSFCRLFGEGECLIEYIHTLMDKTDGKMIGPEAIRKAAHDVLGEYVCIFFAQAIRDTKYTAAVPQLYNFWDEYVMDNREPKRDSELEAARILCDALKDKFEQIACGEEFQFMTALLNYWSGDIWLGRKKYKNALHCFDAANYKATALYERYPKKECLHLIGACFHLAGKAYTAMNKHDAAEKMYTIASGKFYDLFRADPVPDAALYFCEMQYEYALCLWRQKRIMDSEALCLDVIGLYRQMRDMGTPQLMSVLKHLNAYKNACEMLSYIYDLKQGTPSAAPVQDIIQLDSEIKRLERQIEDKLWNPIVIREYARELKEIAFLCEKAGYTIGALHDYVLSTNMMKWAAENGGGSPCIIDYYRSCYELADFYCKLNRKELALKYYLEELQYRRQLLKEYPFLGNAITFSDHCANIGQILLEADNPWGAYEALREAFVCFKSVKDTPASIVDSFSRPKEEYMAEIVLMLQPWLYSPKELEELQQKAKQLLGEDEELHW